MPVSHVHAKIQCWLEASAEERIRYMRSDQYIPYARGELVLSQIGEIMRSPPGVRPECLLIIASPGMGKTAILDYAERRFLQTTHDRIRRGGFVRINLPQIVTDRRLFYIRILKYLGMPFCRSDKADFLHEQSIDALRDSEVRALAIDEFHNFLGPRATHLLEHMVAIRDIANIPISIIGAGTKAVETCVLADDQLEQRFTRQWLVPWGETEELRNFLATLESRLPLKLPSNLAGPVLLPLLVRLSNGHMRRMINLIRQAASEAVTVGTEKVTEDLLHEAFQQLNRISKYYAVTPKQAQGCGGERGVGA